MKAVTARLVNLNISFKHLFTIEPNNDCLGTFTELVQHFWRFLLVPVFVVDDVKVARL